MNKSLRQRGILELLKHGPVGSQEDLQRALRKRGLKVAQATLSRDIRDLLFGQDGGRLLPCLKATVHLRWHCPRSHG